MLMSKKLKVYCETSFWSFLNGRPTPLSHIALKQAATLRWWQEIAPTCDVYISQHVSEESVDGAGEDSAKRLEEPCFGWTDSRNSVSCAKAD